MDGVLNVIGGREVPARSGATLPNWEPATGAPLGTFPDSDAADVAEAVEAARRAFPAWSATPAPVRSRLLRKVADGLRQALPELARAESVDRGKPLSVATEVDIPRGHPELRVLRRRRHPVLQRVPPHGRHALNYTLRHPLGRGGLHLALEPAALPADLEDGPGAGGGEHRGGQAVRGDADDRALARAHRARGRAAARRAQHRPRASGRRSAPRCPAIRRSKAISFTGSTRDRRGDRPHRRAAVQEALAGDGREEPERHLRRRDFDAAVATTVRSSFANQGQICLCGSRIFVERSAIYERCEMRWWSARAR